MRLRRPSQRMFVTFLFSISLVCALAPSGLFRRFEHRLSGLRVEAAGLVASPRALAYKGGQAVATLFEDARGLFAGEKLSELRRKVQALEARVERLSYEMELERRKLDNLTGAQRRLGAAGAVPADIARCETVAAGVIGAEPGIYKRALWINRGAAHGIEDGQGVLWYDVVVGRVKRTGDQSSVVELLSDPAFRTIARVGTDRVEGIVEGAYQSCRMKYVPATAQVSSGDVVVASGQFGRFPPGAVIGKVAEPPRLGADGFLDITVKPAVNLSRILTVVVARSRPMEEATP